MLVKSYKKLSHIKMIVFWGFQPFCLKSSPNVFTVLLQFLKLIFYQMCFISFFIKQYVWLGEIDVFVFHFN